VLLTALGTLATGSAQAAGVERLYILNCGEGVAGDISRWSPGVNVGQSMPFVDNCYLLKHAQGWLLWDTGVPDAIAAMPDGQKPADPKATHWYRPKTLASQLDALGVQPADITFVAVSHTHGDHIGNVELFPQAMLLVQKAEYAWPGANNAPRFKLEHPVTTLEGDKDVFGDGSVTILSTPGHTPGHSLSRRYRAPVPSDAKLPPTGHRSPSNNVDQQTKASMERSWDPARKRDARINHDNVCSATVCRWRRALRVRQQGETSAGAIKQLLRRNTSPSGFQRNPTSCKPVPSML
jgi:hypothetical protein